MIHKCKYPELQTNSGYFYFVNSYKKFDLFVLCRAIKHHTEPVLPDAFRQTSDFMP